MEWAEIVDSVGEPILVVAEVVGVVQERVGRVGKGEELEKGKAHLQ